MYGGQKEKCKKNKKNVKIKEKLKQFPISPFKKNKQLFC